MTVYVVVGYTDGKFTTVLYANNDLSIADIRATDWVNYESLCGNKYTAQLQKWVNGQHITTSNYEPKK